MAFVQRSRIRMIQECAPAPATRRAHARPSRGRHVRPPLIAWAPWLVPTATAATAVAPDRVRPVMSLLAPAQTSVPVRRLMRVTRLVSLRILPVPARAAVQVRPARTPRPRAARPRVPRTSTRRPGTVATVYARNPTRKPAAASVCRAWVARTVRPAVSAPT
jgi:hypothetical protein